MTKTFGPVIHHDKIVGDFTAACAYKGHYCFLLVGRTCTDDRANPRKIPDVGETPDWCQYKAWMLADAREMADFARMGLDRMSRPELLTLARKLPDEHRPRPLTKTRRYDLMKAIRAARLAAVAKKCVIDWTSYTY
jgi:hypothetical protein